MAVLVNIMWKWEPPENSVKMTWSLTVYKWSRVENSITPPGFLGIFFVFLLFVLILLLRWVFVAVRGLSLVAASRGYSLAVAHGVLVAVAPPVGDHGPWSAQASVVAAQHLVAPQLVESSQTSDWCVYPALGADSHPLYHQRSTSSFFKWPQIEGWGNVKMNS